MIASLLLVAAVAFFAAGLTLFSGFGLGTLLLPAFAVFGWPIEVAVAATALVHLANNLFKLGLLGRHARRDVVARFGVPAVVASFAGAALLVRLPADGARVTIGALILVFAVLELWPRFHQLEFPPRALPVGGALSGFLGGLSGHQGALRTAFLVRLHLTREQFLGTGIACAVLIDVARLLVYGGEHWREGFAHVAGIWPAVATGTLAAFAGSWLGARMVGKVTMPAIRLVVGVLLAVLGIALMAGLGAGPRGARPRVVRAAIDATYHEHGKCGGHPEQGGRFAVHGRPMGLLPRRQ
jgi:uncharacterized membrane protein YfcA